MFKRIFSALGGKKHDPQAAVDASQPTQAAAAPAAPIAPVTPGDSVASAPPADEPLITAYDAYGRELKITRSQWRENVFLPALADKRDDPGALYDLIISGLNDGLADDLLPAAERLLEIDPIPERSHTVLGIVQMKHGALDAAEATLRAGIAKVGETGTLLTNLAKVFSERGDEAQADETLWRAVQADPNQDNGLLWWAAIARDRNGEAGYVDALRQAAALPGSWRAQLWLARHHLEQQDVAAARELYAEVLGGGQFDGGALMMITGDLGNKGQIPLMLELVGPVYDEHRHDPMAGLNLLQACQALGKQQEGEALLARMYALGHAPLRQHLDHFAGVFQEMGRQRATSTPIDEHALKVSTVALRQPVWHYGLRNADWLFAQKPEGAPRVGVFALSKMIDGTERAESQREDDLGRLSRAITQYLAEAVHYWTDYAATAYQMVVEGQGPVLSGGESDGHAIFDIVPEDTKFFITGELGGGEQGEGAQWRLALHLWDCTTRTRVTTEHGTATKEELGALMLAMEARLLSLVGLPRAEPFDAFYLRPTAEAMPIYLTELGQTLMLTLTANGHGSKSAMWGERAMLDWPLTMALHWPQAHVPKLMYLAGLGKTFDYQSDVLPEYKDRTLQLLRDAHDAQSPAARLAPLVWQLFGMDAELQAHLRAHADDADPAYRAWLLRVAEAGSK